MKRGKQKGKKTREKVSLVFNIEARDEYLTGFHKRKLQRKAKAREKMVEKFRLEKKRIKERQKNELQTMFYSTRTIPEMEHLVEPVTYDLPNHTVTISSVSVVDMAEKNDLMLGLNKEDDEENGSDAEKADAMKSKLMEKIQHEPKKGISGVNNVIRKEGSKQIRASQLLNRKLKDQSIINTKKQRVRNKTKKKVMKKRDKYKQSHRRPR